MVMPRKWYDADGNRLPCLEDDCDRPIRSNGLCEVHYQEAYYRMNGGLGRKRYTKRRGV